MAQTVHLQLKTASGSEIKGESSQESDGRKDTIECVHFAAAVTTPRDPASGVATGRRQHAPLLIRKRVDSSSPLLAKALTENEKCTGTFKFYRPAQNGKDEVFYTIELKGAFVSDINHILPDTHTNPGVETREMYEDVTFTFDSISWKHIAGTEHEDSWKGGK